MLKRLIYSVVFLICIISLNAQSASDYFPDQSGYIWKFKTTPLDSINSPINELAVSSIDSFAAAGNFKGRESNQILSKAGTEGTINFLPYIDSSFVSLSGSSAAQYLSFVSFLDSLGGSDLSFLNFLSSVTDWYDVYKFDAPVNADRSLFRIDTTITIDDSDYPIRFEVLVKRLNDENLTTSIGTFETKKFDVIIKLSLMVTISPFPPIAVPLIQIPSTNWIAPGNWIVKNYRESVNIDLSLLSGPAFFIPGSETLIQNTITTVLDEQNLNYNIELYQNYPNPFNPSTKISFNILSDGNVNLTIYDLLGREIKVLIDEHYTKGSYSLKFDSQTVYGGISSGVYFYKLISSGQSQIKKMILSK